MKKCKSCNGTGRYYYNPQADDQTCMECHGRGMILTERELIQEKIDLINEKIQELEREKGEIA